MLPTGEGMSVCTPSSVLARSRWGDRQEEKRARVLGYGALSRPTGSLTWVSTVLLLCLVLALEEALGQSPVRCYKNQTPGLSASLSARTAQLGTSQRACGDRKGVCSLLLGTCGELARGSFLVEVGLLMGSPCLESLACSQQWPPRAGRPACQAVWDLGI